jgi:hypothetical protein
MMMTHGHFGGGAPHLNRRECLGVLGAAAVGAALGSARDAEGENANRPKAPYKLLFNNDSTNILTCVSPYHPKRAPFNPSMLKATVDEVDGVDAHLLMPGMGWVPWWQSKVLPIEEQTKWFRDYFGVEPRTSFHDFLLEGGDFVKVFVDRCRLRGQAPFITFRLNDAHNLEYREKPGPTHVVSITKFYMEHPEYWIGMDTRDWYQHVLNWAEPEVRDYKFAFIQELCENYDLDGFELDFMRHCAYFRQQETTLEQRVTIMTDFVKRVRALLDRTAKPGQHRWLSARVPCYQETHGPLGIDLPAMVGAGLDMVNLSPYYFTQQTQDLGTIRESVPDASVYLEMTQATTVGPIVGQGYDNFAFRRNNEHQLYTTAHLAYEQGADGVSLFNFVYYREHGRPGRGPFNEPPFHTFPQLKDPEWLAQQPQWYHLGHDWKNPRRKFVQLERMMRKGKAETFEMACAPTERLKDGVFRLMSERDVSAYKWTVTLNGTQLSPREYVHKPLDHPYDGGLGGPEQYACFTCPVSLTRTGRNQIAITLDEGDDVKVQYMDIVLPV